jgi:hypothetical protein
LLFIGLNTLKKVAFLLLKYQSWNLLHAYMVNRLTFRFASLAGMTRGGGRPVKALLTGRDDALQGTTGESLALTGRHKELDG